MKSIANVKVLKPLVVGCKRFMRFTRQNSNWILALLGVLGLFGTAASCVDATIKAVKICEEKQVKGAKEIVKTVWKLYLPTVGCILVTTTTILGNAHSNAKKLATVTGLYAASQADIKAFKDKAKEMLGKGKVEKVENEVAKDQIHKIDYEHENIAHTGHGDKLFRFKLNGQLVRTSPEYIDLIMERFNNAIEKDPDGAILVSVITRELHLSPSYVDNMYYDLAEMKQHGVQKIEADIREIGWETVNGKEEMVADFDLYPAPEWGG